MSQPSIYEISERQWAESHFLPYLLGRLQDDDERMTTAIALIPGLVDELDEVEEDLIDSYLDRQLPREDIESFENQYLHGDEDNRAKLRLHEALRSPEIAREFELPRSVRSPRLRSGGWALLAAAASIAAVIFGVLYFNQSRQLGIALATLRSQEKTGTPPPRPQTPPEPEPHQARTKPPENPLPGRAGKPNEQPAGLPSDEGLVLRASASGTLTITVAQAPSRLIWTPVPDYRNQYRIQVRSANGTIQTSPSLDPQDNAVEYQLNDPAAMALPWEVLVLGTPDSNRVFGRYTLTKR